MNGADFPGSIANDDSPAGNGTHRTKKNGATPKRPARTGGRTDERPAPQPMDTTFVTVEAEPIDAPMWLLHSALWFQPEVAPSIPVWTGLAI